MPLLHPIRHGLITASKSGLHSIDSGIGGIAGAGAAFSPLDLFAGGRQGFWFDPSDLITLFQAVGGTTPVAADNDPVGYIEDKSGNGHEATRITGDTQRALYKTSGGLHWLEFDGSNDAYKVLPALSIFANIGYVSVIIGLRVGDNAANKTPFFISRNGSPSIARTLIRVSATEVLVLGGRRLDADSFDTAGTNGTLTPATPQVLTAQFRYANANCIGRLNGVEVINDATFQTAGNTSNTPSDNVALGASNETGTVEPWLGRIYGLIVVNADLSAQEISDAEEWMAAKCGISL